MSQQQRREQFAWAILAAVFVGILLIVIFGRPVWTHAATPAAASEITVVQEPCEEGESEEDCFYIVSICRLLAPWSEEWFFFDCYRRLYGNNTLLMSAPDESPSTPFELITLPDGRPALVHKHAKPRRPLKR